MSRLNCLLFLFICMALFFRDTENVHINRRVGLTNPHVKSLPEDHLYHIGLNNREHDLQKLFGDVKVSSIVFQNN